MTYIMSDIHGCDEKYFSMLEKIGFTANDTLYILGDVIDRGDGGIIILQDMMRRKNIIPFLGNHEDMALSALEYMSYEDIPESEMIERPDFTMWLINGGCPTWNAFLKHSFKERKKNRCLYPFFPLEGRDLCKRSPLSSFPYFAGN